MADLSKLDLYGLLEVAPDATEKEIVKAYRKKALKCHPDKNPDNPKAADEFHQLSRALEVLSDEAARAAYDKILKAKKATELRNKVLDSKRKKFKEDLEARERAAEEKKESAQDAQEKLQREIDRLRKEGSRLLEQEQERLATELREQRERLKEAAAQEDNSPADVTRPSFRLKVKWKAKKTDESNGGYNRENLEKIFDKYGSVIALVVSSKKKGSAIVEFDNSHAGTLAIQHETGHSDNPLTVSWLGGEPPATTEPPTGASSQQEPVRPPPVFQSAPPVKESDLDFESLVLMRLRQAEERKRLIAQMQKEDEEEGT